MDSIYLYLKSRTTYQNLIWFLMRKKMYDLYSLNPKCSIYTRKCVARALLSKMKDQTFFLFDNTYSTRISVLRHVNYRVSMIDGSSCSITRIISKWNFTFYRWLKLNKALQTMNAYQLIKQPNVKNIDDPKHTDLSQ